MKTVFQFVGYAGRILVLVAMAALPAFAQSSVDLHKFFQQEVGLSEEDIANIQHGKAVVKVLPSRTQAEVFEFGAVYVHARPESYLKFALDFDRFRQLPAYLALGVIEDPPQAADFKGFSFEDGDIKALKNCKPGDCPIKLPANAMGEFQRSVDWSAPDVNEKVNEALQETALKRLRAYRKEGNRVLAVYNDKRVETDVGQQFAYMLSYAKALPAYLPDFYRYLLDYPDRKPANVEDAFYWSRVKFGLKPTLRVVQVVTMRGRPGDAIACAVAEKQLYASHYFDTALDMSFCVQDDISQHGFYLITVKGSESTALTTFRGAIIRKAAVDRSRSSLKDVLSTIRNILEENP